MAERITGTVETVVRTGDYAYIKRADGRTYFAWREQMVDPDTIVPGQLVEFGVAPAPTGNKCDYALAVVAIGLIAADKKDAA